MYHNNVYREQGTCHPFQKGNMMKKVLIWVLALGLIGLSFSFDEVAEANEDDSPSGDRLAE